LIAVEEIPLAPPAELRFRARIGLPRFISDLVRSRELVRTLAERDIRARYKQAILGFTWVFVQPLSLLLVFMFLARHVASVNTHGVPYPIYAYIGLLPWQFFSSALSVGGLSLVTNSALLNKVYCPRQVFPTAGVMVAAVDATLATLVLVVLFIVDGFTPKATSYYVPLILLVQIAFTLAICVAVSAIVVYVRDVKNVLPLVLQIGLFATPVAYEMTKFPASWRVPYSIINPLGPVIDAYRRTVLLGKPPVWSQFGAGAASAMIMLVLAAAMFSKSERGMADVL